MIFGEWTYYLAAKIPTAMISLVISIKRLSTFVTTLVGGEIYKEKNLFFKSIICLIMVIGVYLITL